MNSRAFSKALSCYESALQRAAFGQQLQRRAFTNSSVLQKNRGAVPKFTNSSNPLLNGILTQIREEYILPGHLSRQQVELIFWRQNIKTFETERITANIAGEEFVLKHIDKDARPPVRKLISRALDLFKTKEDWGNLLELLRGLLNARVKLRSADYRSIITAAVAARQNDVILQCIQSANTTGMNIGDWVIFRTVVQGYWKKAFDSDFNMEETKRTLRWLELIAIELEEKRAVEIRSTGYPGYPYQPILVGFLLQLASRRASDHLAGIDKDLKVAGYAEKLLGIPYDFPPPLARAEKEHSAEARLQDDLSANSNQPYHHSVNIWLARVIPVLDGMKLAAKVLGPSSEAATGLQERAAALEKQVGLFSIILEEETKDLGKDFTGPKLHEWFVKSWSS